MSIIHSHRNSLGELIVISAGSLNGEPVELLDGPDDIDDGWGQPTQPSSILLDAGTKAWLREVCAERDVPDSHMGYVLVGSPSTSVELASVRTKNEVDAAFVVFWDLYDRTGPRKKAHECFAAAVRRGHTFEQIIEGLRAWVVYWAQPGSAARKWPQGFLNQEYYLDEPPAVRVETSRKAMPGRGGIEAALAARSQRGIGSGS